MENKFLEELILYVLFAIVTAIVIIFIFMLFKMVMYNNCVNHSNNIYYCEAKWL